MRRLVLVALLAGVAGGSIVAVAVPHTRDPVPPRVAPQRQFTGPPIAHVKLRLLPGSMRIELRRSDPEGGPSWAIRSYTVVRAGHSLRTRLNCQQLGRVFKGRFGWIDGSNVFRPAGLEYAGQAPALCGESIPGPHRPVQIDARTLISGIEGPAARLTTTVAWGVGGEGTKQIDLRVGNRRTREHVSGRGAFLAFLVKPQHRSQLSVTFTYAGDVRNTVPLDRRYQFDLPIGADQPKPDAGPVRLLARAPDPAGGLPYGLGGVRSKDGGWCLGQPQRVVADRVGAVDLDLGTFVEAYFESTSCVRRGDERLRRHGVGESYQFGGGITENEGAAAKRARVIRRTQSGSTIVAGMARADVRSITIKTPRDVRTLIPTSSAHAFIAVYDGGFPTGKIVTTAHFADGTSRVVDSFDVGGL